MPSPEEIRAHHWFCYVGQEEQRLPAPDAFKASLIPYTGIEVQYTQLACVYAKPDSYMLMTFNPERPVRNNERYDEVSAARKIHQLTPSPVEWAAWVELHQQMIQEEYPALAHSEASLFRRALKEVKACGLPPVMVGFGFTFPDEQPIATLVTPTVFRIDRALARFRKGCEHLL